MQDTKSTKSVVHKQWNLWKGNDENIPNYNSNNKKKMFRNKLNQRVEKFLHSKLYYVNEEMKEDTDNWKPTPCSCIRRINIVNSPAMQETWVQSLGGEDHLKKEMAIHYTILAWEIPWTKKPGELQSMGSQKSGAQLNHLTTITTVKTTMTFFTQWS